MHNFVLSRELLVILLWSTLITSCLISILNRLILDLECKRRSIKSPTESSYLQNRWPTVASESRRRKRSTNFAAIFRMRSSGATNVRRRGMTEKCTVLLSLINADKRAGHSFCGWQYRNHNGWLDDICLTRTKITWDIEFVTFSSRANPCGESD